MISGTLTLLGTIHLYRELAPRLFQHLETIKPDVITVEISRFSLRFRSRALPVWLTVLRRNLRTLPIKKRGHAGIRLLNRQLHMPYEWTVAFEYARSRGIRCIPVDTGNFARFELPSWHCELLSHENLRIITAEPDFALAPYFAARHEFARLFIDGRRKCCDAAHPLSYLRHRQWQERERAVARRIKRISKLRCKTAHICGWTHLVTQSPWQSLADRLAPLEVERMLVN